MTKPKSIPKKKAVGRPAEWTPKKRQELGESLVEFCKLDHVFHLVQWTREQGKTAAWWHDMRQKYPDLIEYHLKAKDILGGKILQLAFESGNNWAIQTFIPKYLTDVQNHLDKNADKEYARKKHFEKYKNSLNQAREDEAVALITNFDKSQELMIEMLKMKDFLKQKGLLEEFDSENLSGNR